MFEALVGRREVLQKLNRFDSITSGKNGLQRKWYRILYACSQINGFGAIKLWPGL